MTSHNNDSQKKLGNKMDIKSKLDNFVNRLDPVPNKISKSINLKSSGGLSNPIENSNFNPNLKTD